MKTPKLLLSVLLCMAMMGSYAQNVPTHDKYVELLPTKVVQEGDPKEDKTVYLDLFDYFVNWEPGTKLSEDENFYIGRVPL